MAEQLRLELTLEPRGPAGALVLSNDQVAALADGAKAFPVRVEIGDQVLSLRLTRMGGQNLIGFSKAARAEAGLELGDQVTVRISLDQSERIIELPADLAAALAAQPSAAAAFDKLAPSARKEIVVSITEAKREQTRTDRIAKAIQRLG
jgi:Uncharacterized protein conserved in bacteria